MAATNLTISPVKAQELVKRADAAMAKIAKIRGKTEEKVGEVFKMFETVGGSIAVGAARAKWGEVTVGPNIPVEAVLGAGLSLAAFLDLPGKYSEHLHNVGNGILSGWGTLEAVKLGGGIVLSNEEYARLQASSQQTHEAPAPAGEKQAPVAKKEMPALPPNGHRSAREILAAEERQAQEAERSNS